MQTIGSEENQGLADFGVIQYYGWKKVTIFQLDVDSFEIVRLYLLLGMINDIIVVLLLIIERGRDMGFNRYHLTL